MVTFFRGRTIVAELRIVTQRLSRSRERRELRAAIVIYHMHDPVSGIVCHSFDFEIDANVE